MIGSGKSMNIAPQRVKLMKNPDREIFGLNILHETNQIAALPHVVEGHTIAMLGDENAKVLDAGPKETAPAGETTLALGIGKFKGFVYNDSADAIGLLLVSLAPIPHNAARRSRRELCRACGQFSARQGAVPIEE
jgi:hypothetical protein